VKCDDGNIHLFYPPSKRLRKTNSLQSLDSYYYYYYLDSYWIGGGALSIYKTNHLWTDPGAGRGESFLILSWAAYDASDCCYLKASDTE